MKLNYHQELLIRSLDVPTPRNWVLALGTVFILVPKHGC